MLKTLATLFALVVVLNPTHAKAAVCAMNGKNPVQCTAAQQAHLDWVASLDAPAPVATKATTTKSAIIQVPVLTEAQTKAQRAEQIAQLNALIKQLKSLLAALQASK